MRRWRKIREKGFRHAKILPVEIHAVGTDLQRRNGQDLADRVPGTLRLFCSSFDKPIQTNKRVSRRSFLTHVISPPASVVETTFLQLSVSEQ